MRLTDEQIRAELTALRETPSEQFAAELDAWAAEGFPAVKDLKTSESRLAPSFWPRRRPLLAAAACAVLVITVAAAGVAGYLGGRNNDTVTPLSSIRDESSNKLSAKPSTGAAAAPDVFLQQASPPRNNRTQIQELSASLGLSTDADKIQEAADGVVQVAGRYEGFVDSSNVHVGGSDGHARFTLRIPAAHLRDALDDLSDLGRVTLRDEGSANVTGAYVDAGKSYRDARAKVDSLLEELGNASSPSEADAIRQQLETARQELAASRAALGGVKQRVTYAPVSVEITAQGDGNWSIGDAADDAVGVLEAIGGAALITLAVLVPLGVLSALAWFGAQALQRRRRESSLDS
jgi:hypothetical protein